MYLVDAHADGAVVGGGLVSDAPAHVHRAELDAQAPAERPQERVHIYMQHVLFTIIVLTLSRHRSIVHFVFITTFSYI